MKKFKLSAAALLLLASCASYNASSLRSSTEAVIQTSEENKQAGFVTVAKAFTKSDCKRYLDRDVISKGYQPVQLFIQNNTDQNYSFRLDRMSLSYVEPEVVAAKVHTSTLGRAVGYGVGALFIWPLAIPAIVDGIKSSEANTALDNDFASKAAKDQIVYSHSYLNKLIFVPIREYEQSFTVTLMDLETNTPKTLKIVAGRE